MQKQGLNTMDDAQLVSIVRESNEVLPKDILEEREYMLKNNMPFGCNFDPRFMNLAIDEANTCLSDKECGPFGAVCVYGNVIIGLGHNKVIKNNDPTCHAEIDCIRNACSWLGSYDLTGCVLYSSCEPCPMCLTACKWANIEKVYYANTKRDAEDIGFRDKELYEMFFDKTYRDWCRRVLVDDALYTFKQYAKYNITY